MLHGFVLGLMVGILLLAAERVRQRKHLQRLLQDIPLREPGIALPVFNQLSLAIATQQRNYQILQQQKERERTLLQDAPISVLHIDDENRLVWCNASAQALFNIQTGGYPRPRLLLELVRSYELDQLVEQVRQRDEHYQQDWTFFPINANPAHVIKQRSYRLRGHGIPLGSGHVGLFVENRQEITILEQQRDRWTSDVAHEIKTPLTSIRLIAETLQARLDPTLVGWAERLVTQSTRLSSLVRDLLDLSQLELDGVGTLPLRSVNLPELIQSAWLNLEPIARKKNLQITYTGTPQLMVQVDESQIYRVFSNLFDNSIKYSPPGENIKVVVQTVKTPIIEIADDINMVQIEVIDAGPGFPEEDLPYIFERFYRADEARPRPSQSLSSPEHPHRPPVPVNEALLDEPVISSIPLSEQTSALNCHLPSPDASQTSESDSTHSGGTGLGLAIVQQIIKAHGGYLEAYNHPRTGGAVIRVRFPKDGTVIL
ncbi:MAG: PAS domain-containing sensor histidine kinase [Cyanothece sp. SIO2G6]|nr:PAS domain-containing sensor histidine kinase [Cyanothece sp. SIO2G6]